MTWFTLYIICLNLLLQVKRERERENYSEASHPNSCSFIFTSLMGKNIPLITVNTKLLFHMESFMADD